MISKTKITSICEDKFDAKKEHDGQKRINIFNQKTLHKLSVNYTRLDEIEIINDLETNIFNTFNTFWDHIEKNRYDELNSKYNDISENNHNDSRSKVKNGNYLQNITSEYNQKIVPSSVKVLKPLEVLEKSKEINLKVIQKEDNTIPNYIYRIGQTDLWGCKNCKFKDDIWFMKKHPCKVNNKI
jgi:hypothetical protein